MYMRLVGRCSKLSSSNIVCKVFSVWLYVGVKYHSTVGRRLRPVGIDMIDSLQWQAAEESSTPHYRTAPPLQTEEGGATYQKY
jgi:hypothetical protein